MRYLNIPIVGALNLFHVQGFAPACFNVSWFFQTLLDRVRVAAGHLVLPVKVGDCTWQG